MVMRRRGGRRCGVWAGPRRTWRDGHARGDGAADKGRERGAVAAARWNVEARLSRHDARWGDEMDGTLGRPAGGVGRASLYQLRRPPPCLPPRSARGRPVRPLQAAAAGRCAAGEATRRRCPGGARAGWGGAEALRGPGSGAAAPAGPCTPAARAREIREARRYAPPPSGDAAPTLQLASIPRRWGPAVAPHPSPPVYPARQPPQGGARVEGRTRRNGPWRSAGSQRCGSGHRGHHPPPQPCGEQRRGGSHSGEPVYPERTQASARRSGGAETEPPRGLASSIALVTQGGRSAARTAGQCSCGRDGARPDGRLKNTSQ